MAQYVPKRVLAMPAVKAFVEIDTSQFTTRQRNALIKQIRCGVLSKSALGTVARNIINGTGGGTVKMPIQRWYSPILVRKEYMAEQSVMDMLSAAEVTATLRGEKDDVASRCAGKMFAKDPSSHYYDYMYYTGLVCALDVITFENSEKWQRIVAPAIAALEKGEVIRCRLTN